MRQTTAVTPKNSTRGRTANHDRLAAATTRPDDTIASCQQACLCWKIQKYTSKIHVLVIDALKVRGISTTSKSETESYATTISSMLCPHCCRPSNCRLWFYCLLYIAKKWKDTYKPPLVWHFVMRKATSKVALWFWVDNALQRRLYHA